MRWYADLFNRFPLLKGMEIYNQGDRYPGDRAKWDAVLTRLMPARPVRGFSNDDMHTEKQLGRNWSIVLVPELTDEGVRRSLDAGRLLFVYAPQGHDGPPTVIHSLEVDRKRARIDVTVSGHARLEWISEVWGRARRALPGRPHGAGNRELCPTDGLRSRGGHRRRHASVRDPVPRRINSAPRLGVCVVTPAAASVRQAQLPSAARYSCMARGMVSFSFSARSALMGWVRRKPGVLPPCFSSSAKRCQNAMAASGLYPARAM